MDESSTPEIATINIQSEVVKGTISSPTDSGPEIHPIISNAEALDIENHPALYENTSQDPPVFHSPTQDIEEDTDLDTFHDLSHVSHHNQTSDSCPENRETGDEPGTGVPSQSIEQEQSAENEEVISLAEFNVWDVVDSTGHHIVATIDPDESAIADEGTPNAITAMPDNEVTDHSRLDQIVASKEEAPAWLVILALIAWCCFLIILVWLISILIHATDWESVFEAVKLPLIYLDDRLSFIQAKGVDFVAGGVIAPAFIVFANFSWFGIGRRLSPKEDVKILIPMEDTGTFNVSKILGLVKTCQPRTTLLAILLFSSALAATLLSNIIGYKAVPPEKTQSASKELMYQIVYMPGLLLPALCAFTSASTAALLLIVLDWKCALSVRKQASEQAKIAQAIVTDEHGVVCEETTRAHNYVSFPRFRTGRRLFSRAGIEMFRGASADSELEPLLQRTRSQMEGRANVGSWRLPSFEFPSFRFGRKVGDIEGSEVPEQLVETPGTMSGWKFPYFRFPTWSGNPSPIANEQQELTGEIDVGADLTNSASELTIKYVRKGRKFWKLPTYGSISSQPVPNLSTEVTESSSAANADQISTSLWKLPFPGRFSWPPGDWRTKRRTRQREEALDASSLLSQAESQQAILSNIARTSSSRNLAGLTEHSAAPNSRGKSRDLPIAELTSMPRANIPPDGTPYVSESWRSWMIPRVSFLSSRTVSSELGAGDKAATLHQTGESTRGSLDASHADLFRVLKLQKRDYSSSSSWFPSFRFPQVAVDVPPPDTKPRPLLPAFEQTTTKDIARSSSRILTASEALNIAIGKQPAQGTRRNDVRGQSVQTSSHTYTKNHENMIYEHSEATFNDDRVYSTLLRGNDPSRSAVAAKVTIPNSHAARSTSWIHSSLFTKNRGDIGNSSQLHTSIEQRIEDNARNAGAAPPIPRASQKGKQREQYVDQFESTREPIHHLTKPVSIREESITIAPPKIYTEEDIITQKQHLGIGKTPFGSRRFRSQDTYIDVESCIPGTTSSTRTASPLRKVAAPYHQVDDEAHASHRTEDPAIWKRWTWWDVTWSHLVSRSPSASTNTDSNTNSNTNPSSRQISGSSKTSNDDSAPTNNSNSKSNSNSNSNSKSDSKSPTPDLEAQNQSPEQSNSTSGASGIIRYNRKRPLWGLGGRSSNSVPLLSPLSVVLPGYVSLSPELSSPNANLPSLSPSPAHTSADLLSSSRLQTEETEAERGERSLSSSPCIENTYPALTRAQAQAPFEPSRSKGRHSSLSRKTVSVTQLDHHSQSNERESNIWAEGKGEEESEERGSGN